MVHVEKGSRTGCVRLEPLMLLQLCLCAIANEVRPTAYGSVTSPWLVAVVLGLRCCLSLPSCAPGLLSTHTAHRCHPHDWARRTPLGRLATGASLLALATVLGVRWARRRPHGRDGAKGDALDRRSNDLESHGW